MSRSIIYTIAIILCFSGVSSLYATNYYVATNGDDGAKGEKTSPFKSVSTAVAKAGAGDSIIVAAGTYICSATINLTKTGSSGHTIYLGCAAGDRPVLDFSSMAVGDANYGIKLSGQYWYIKGLLIKGAGDNGMLFQGGSNNIVEFCDFLENRDSGCQLKGGAANNKIINCDSYYNRDPDEGDADGFSPKMDVGSGNSFYGCRAWQNSDDGWDGYLRGADNVNTRLENCWCFKNGYRKDGSASSGNGNGFKMGGSDDKDLKHNFVLIRCLAFENRVKGFDQNNNRGAMTLYNCTSYGNGTNYSIDGGSSSLTAINCIAAGSGSSSLSGGTQKTNNLNAAASNFISVDPASAKGPRKADGSLPDLTFMHLKAGSTLIDNGTVISDVTYNGSKPDLGCFETEGTTAAGKWLQRSAELSPVVRLVNANGSILIVTDNFSAVPLSATLVTVNGVRVWKGIAGETVRGQAAMVVPSRRLSAGNYILSVGQGTKMQNELVTIGK
jgi:hypothetical protein